MHIISYLQILFLQKIIYFRYFDICSLDSSPLFFLFLFSSFVWISFLIFFSLLFHYLIWLTLLYFFTIFFFALTSGIIPRVVEALFTAVTEADESIEFTFKVTYVEIYMEKIRDLLDESRLKVRIISIVKNVMKYYWSVRKQLKRWCWCYKWKKLWYRRGAIRERDFYWVRKSLIVMIVGFNKGCKCETVEALMRNRIMICDV